MGADETRPGEETDIGTKANAVYGSTEPLFSREAPALTTYNCHFSLALVCFLV